MLEDMELELRRQLKIRFGIEFRDKAETAGIVELPGEKLVKKSSGNQKLSLD